MVSNVHYKKMSKALNAEKLRVELFRGIFYDALKIC